MRSDLTGAQRSHRLQIAGIGSLVVGGQHVHVRVEVRQVPEGLHEQDQTWPGAGGSLGEWIDGWYFQRRLHDGWRHRFKASQLSYRDRFTVQRKVTQNHFNFAEPREETVWPALCHSWRSVLTRQGISLPKDLITFRHRAGVTRYTSTFHVSAIAVLDRAPQRTARAAPKPRPSSTVASASARLASAVCGRRDAGAFIQALTRFGAGSR